MTVSVSTFRASFAEFNSSATYPDSMIQIWIDYMSRRMSVERWGDLYDQGLMLSVAHFTTLAARRLRAAGAGGVPGMLSGPQTSKSVDKVSVSSDVSSVTVAGAGHWNQTEYGVMYSELVDMVGAGGMQV